MEKLKMMLYASIICFQLYGCSTFSFHKNYKYENGVFYSADSVLFEIPDYSYKYSIYLRIEEGNNKGSSYKCQLHCVGNMPFEINKIRLTQDNHEVKKNDRTHFLTRNLIGKYEEIFVFEIEEIEMKKITTSSSMEIEIDGKEHNTKYIFNILDIEALKITFRGS